MSFYAFSGKGSSHEFFHIIVKDQDTVGGSKDRSLKMPDARRRHARRQHEVSQACTRTLELPVVLRGPPDTDTVDDHTSTVPGAPGTIFSPTAFSGVFML
jgi:hypothetical protein